MVKVCETKDLNPTSYVNYVFLTLGLSSSRLCLSILMIGQFSACVGYTMFFIDYFQMSICHFGFSDLCEERGLIGLIAACLIFPLTFIQTMSQLKKFCGYALILVFISLGGILIYCYQLLDSRGPVDDIKTFDFGQIPLSLGLINGGFESCGIYFEIRSSMQNRLNFASIMHWIVNASTVILLIFSTICYFTFGADVKMFVILELPFDNWFYVLLLLFYCLQLIVSYSLMIFPVSVFLVNSLCSKEEKDDQQYQPINNNENEQIIQKDEKLKQEDNDNNLNNDVNEENQQYQTPAIQNQLEICDQYQTQQNQSGIQNEQHEISQNQQNSGQIQEPNVNQAMNHSHIQQQQSLNNSVLENDKYRKYQYLIIFTLNCAVFFIALYITNKGMFLSFFGSLFSSFMLYFFPIFIFQTHITEAGLAQKILNFLILIFGIAMGIFGCFQSGKAIIKDNK